MSAGEMFTGMAVTVAFLLWTLVALWIWDNRGFGDFARGLLRRVKP